VARQFDIVENLNKSTRDLYPYLLILQHDLVTSIQSVVVAPLVRTERAPKESRLHPSLDVAGHRYTVLTEDLASLSRSRLDRTVGSAASRYYDIVAAIDLLFTGI
jgi:toxin CcdB